MWKLNSGVLLLGMAIAASAQDRPPRAMLDLLPRSEFGALVFRNPSELRRRGEELIDAVGVSMTYRPSDALNFGLNWLGIRESFDDRQPVAAIFASHDRKDFDFEGIVVAAPFKDRERMMADVRLKAAPGEVADIAPGARLGSDFWLCGAVDDRYLFLGGGRNRDVARSAVSATLSGPWLSTDATAAARARLNEADVLLHMGAEELLRRDESRADRDFLIIGDRQLDPEERAAATEITRVGRDLQHVYVTLGLDDGLSSQLRMQFRGGEDSTAARLLRELRAGEAEAPPPAPPALTALPAGPVLAAGAARLPHARQQLLIRTVAKLLAPGGGQVTSGWFVNWQGGGFTDVRQALVLGALVEVLPLTTESRFALYPNGDGTAALIVILDAPQPQRVVTAIHELSDLLVEGGAPPAADSPTRPTASDADLRKLVRELGAEDFSVRSRAATRLLLLGERARPALVQAAAADDPEVAARATSLLAKFEASAHTRDQRLLEDNPLVGAHPRLTYHVAAEQSSAGPVDVIQLELPPDEAAREKQLAAMFGPQWNRIRLAALERHVVLAFGSGPRFDEAIANLQEARAGLAHDPRLVGLPPDPARLLGVHFPLSRLMANSPRRFNGGPVADERPSRALTAVGVSASGEELALDIHLPIDELRTVVAKRGWSW